MAEKTLFLAWRDTGESRRWFPVGRLDADVDNSNYRFRYTGGAERAKAEVGFPPILSFPELTGDYRSLDLFPLFQNRVMHRARPDFQSYLETLGFDGSANPVEILAVNGGRRVTDNYEVFPKLVKRPDGGFVCKFLLHGARYASPSGQERLKTLEPGEKLSIALELTNPVAKLAVQIQTTDYQILGWAPNYLVDDLTNAVVESLRDYKARVVRVHPQRHSSLPSLLVEFRSYWENHVPMSGRDYQPLVGGD